MENFVFLDDKFYMLLAVDRFIVQEAIFAHKQIEGVEIVDGRERNA